MSVTELTTNDAEDPGFWCRLCPELSIEQSSPVEQPFEFDDVPGLVDLLRVEGYVNVPDVIPVGQVGLMRTCIDRLYERHIPVVFAFVYDEFWSAFQNVSTFVGSVLGSGYRALPDFWVWRVKPSDFDSGWEPHWDRAVPTFESDNMPHSLTVWIALSEANPLNGCIYVVPAHLDERFERRVWESNNIIDAKNLQNIRALPATAGSMLAWNQGLIHWGSRASWRAREPRRSAAFEFQRGDIAPINEPLLEVSPALAFHQRLALIGNVLIRYQRRHPLTAALREIAETLLGRGLPSPR